MNTTNPVIIEVVRGVVGEILIASVLYDDEGFILTDDSDNTIDLNL